MKVKKIHAWKVSPEEAILIQRRLQKRLKLTPLRKRPTLIAGADVSFRKDKAVGAVVVLTFPELEIVEKAVKEKKLIFPYIPTLLSFREGPVLLESLRSLESNPDIIIFDGQGIAHPRGMGLASHLGIMLGKPSIGCAKSRLCGEYLNPKDKKGDFSDLKDRDGKEIGAVLRTRENVKPVFISPGHMIDICDSVNIVIRCCKKYRIPEPIRIAHALSRE